MMPTDAWSYPLEAIACAIGSAMLVSREHRSVRALTRLTADDMPEPYSQILMAVKSLHATGKPVDLVTVKNWLTAAGMYDDQWRVAELLIACAEAVPSPQNGPEYCEIIERASAARKTIALTESALGLMQKATDPQEVESARRELQAKLREGRRKRVTETVKLAKFVHSGMQGANGIPTIFPTVNTKLTDGAGGFTRGTLNVIGGLRGSSKTNLMVQQAIQSASSGIPTVIFSLEMGPRQIAQRMMKMLTGYSRVPMDDEGQPDMFSEEFQAWEAAQKLADTWPLVIEAPNKVTADDLVELMHDYDDLGYELMLTDYAQLLTNSSENVYNETRIVSEQLRQATLDMPNVVHLLLSQLTDKGEGQYNARGGQDWENPAAMVWLLMPETAQKRADHPQFAKGNPNSRKALKWRMTKNRYGPGTGAEIPIYLDTKFLRLYEDEQDYE